MTYGNYPDLAGVKKVLVIKLRQLGDVLLTSPVFHCLQNRLPNAKIDAYVYSESIPLLEGHSSIRRCIGYDRGWKKLSTWTRLAKEWAVLQSIRKENYDLVINLTEGDRGALAARFSHAPIRVGFDPKKGGFFGKRNLYTHIVKTCPSLRHTVERNLDALRSIGLFPSWEERELQLPISLPALARMKERIPVPFLLIHPTSRWRFKCWPAQKMRQLTEQLIDQGYRIVFTSGPDKDELAMIDQITGGLDVINLAGQISLQELAALVRQCEALLCVDSLPFHLASAFKKPVVALFGPTSEITWGPWRNPHARIVAQPFSCRPCYQDGCGGSKLSDCLDTLPIQPVLTQLNSILQLVPDVTVPVPEGRNLT